MDTTAATDSVFTALNPGGIPGAVFTLVVTIFVVRMAEKGLSSAAERFTRRRLFLKQLGSFAAFALYFLGGLVAINQVFTLSREVLLALSGTLAVALGFALKDFAASLLASITILISKPFQVGDRISFDGFYGEVVDIGLRAVRLVTLDDNLVTIPSHRFLNEPVASANAGALDCMVVVDFYIGASADHGLAKRLVEESVLASQYLYLGKPFTVLINTELNYHGQVMTHLKAKAFVFDARYEKAFASDITDQALVAFREHDIPLG